ncbi:hypothetical protein NDN08_004290 [Rhodosorus marinus]|uniref:C2H2-type domain-containing protein n=1 Tax=Rhodosorus marinus TaxID=101924 RepID=A0AAV8UKV1_9RHOD|nr:hypothetical protein NDN08_004290 [Rhodosorus marinus]
MAIDEGAVVRKVGRFECPVPGCGKKLMRKHNLKVHMRIHNEEMPYSCLVAGCGRKFKWRSSFQNHIRYHEAGVMNFSVVNSFQQDGVEKVEVKALTNDGVALAAATVEAGQLNLSVVDTFKEDGVEKIQVDCDIEGIPLASSTMEVGEVNVSVIEAFRQDGVEKIQVEAAVEGVPLVTATVPAEQVEVPNINVMDVLDMSDDFPHVSSPLHLRLSEFYMEDFLDEDQTGTVDLDCHSFNNEEPNFYKEEPVIYKEEPVMLQNQIVRREDTGTALSSLLSFVSAESDSDFLEDFRAHLPDPSPVPQKLPAEQIKSLDTWDSSQACMRRSSIKPKTPLGVTDPLADFGDMLFGRGSNITSLFGL